MSSAQPVSMRRAMGTGDVALFLVACAVGLRWIATAAAAGPSSLVVWGLAFASFFLPLASTVVTLTKRYPEEGGLYAWTRHAFGDRSAFICGWMYWTSNLVYFPGLLYFSAGNALYIGGPSWLTLSDSPSYYVIASLCGLSLALGLNLLGLGLGKWLHNAGGVGSWAPVLLLVVMGGIAWAHFGSATPLDAASLAPSSVGAKDLVFWSTIAFGFGGFEAASLMSEEIRDPERTIPRAIVVAGAIVTAVYVLGTLAVLVALPQHEVSSLQGLIQAIDATAVRIGWGWAGPVAALLMTVGNIGGIGAWLASTARLPFVAGVDRRLPPAFGRLHPRYGTPYVALIVQAVGAALFVVLGQAGTDVRGAYDFLVGLGVISYFIPYLYMFATLLKLPAVPTGRRALAALGLAVTAASIVLAAMPPEGTADPALAVIKVVGSSVALVAVGLWIYLRAPRRD
jgi:amino acid transporter